MFNGIEQQAVASEVVESLADVGIRVASLDHLTMDEGEHAAAVPILLAWLPKMPVGYWRLRMINLLGQRWAHDQVMPTLVQAFTEVDPEQGPNPIDRDRWSLAVAISNAALRNDASQLLQLVKQSRFGIDRRPLVYAVSRWPALREESIPIFRDLLQQKGVELEAAAALVRLCDVESLPLIEAVERRIEISGNDVLLRNIRKESKRLRTIDQAN